MEIQHCHRCQFQCDTDCSLTHMQSKEITFQRDWNLTLIFTSETECCHLRQILTAAKHVSSHSKFVHGVNYPCMYKKSYWTHSLSRTLQRLTPTTGCTFNKQYFVVLTKGYSQSIIKALSREGSTPCLSIYLPWMSLTFLPRACIDNPPSPPPRSLRHTYCPSLQARFIKCSGACQQMIGKCLCVLPCGCTSVLEGGGTPVTSF